MNDAPGERPTDSGVGTSSGAPTKPRKSTAGTVAAGILASRVFGFIRERAVAHFFGVGLYADVLQVAFRGPNLLQNLLGEGSMSAAFIPVYARMIEEGREEEAGRFAGAVFGFLLAIAGGLSLVGILFAEPIVAVMAPGWLEDATQVASGTLPVNRFELASGAIRIVFPMAGLLVLAAWCLGVLNSHRRFFLPYFAPVLWNVAIAGMLVGTALLMLEPGSTGQGPGGLSATLLNDLLFAAVYGALFGGLLQFAVQLPLVFRVLRGFRLSISTRIAGVRETFRAFGPAVVGRGVYQISSFLDIVLASFLAEGAVSSLRFAQMLYLLPVGLFGLSVAASELPEFSRCGAGNVEALTSRLKASAGQMLFVTIPACIGYLVFGLPIVGALFRTGAFGQNEVWLVYLVLGAYSLGLLATTASRLLQNAFYALKNTRTPAWIAGVRVFVSTLVALPLMFVLDGISIGQAPGTEPDGRLLYLGSVGLALGASAGAWVELWRLGKSLGVLLPTFHFAWGRMGRMTATAVLAAIPALIVWALLPDWHAAIEALIVLTLYGCTYLGVSYVQRTPEIEPWLERLPG